jgi:uncharacterized protein
MERVKAFTQKCAICGKPAAASFKPFCSKRCADIDLGRWLGESYKVACAADAGEEEKPSLPNPDDGEDG